MKLQNYDFFATFPLWPAKKTFNLVNKKGNRLEMPQWTGIAIACIHLFQFSADYRTTYGHTPYVPSLKKRENGVCLPSFQPNENSQYFRKNKSTDCFSETTNCFFYRTDCFLPPSSRCRKPAFVQKKTAFTLHFCGKGLTLPLHRISNYV